MAKNPERPKFELPDDFAPVSRSRIDGWYVLQEGNRIQGILEDKFIVKGQFGPKTTFKIRVTKGETLATDAEDEDNQAMMGEGSIIGVDKKGFLNGLDDIEKGCEVFIVCTGKQDPKQVKKGQSPAWMFIVGAKPLAKGEGAKPLAEGKVPF